MWGSKSGHHDLPLPLFNTKSHRRSSSDKTPTSDSSLEKVVFVEPATNLRTTAPLKLSQSSSLSPEPTSFLGIQDSKDVGSLESTDDLTSSTTTVIAAPTAATTDNVVSTNKSPGGRLSSLSNLINTSSQQINSAFNRRRGSGAASQSGARNSVFSLNKATIASNDDDQLRLSTSSATDTPAAGSGGGLFSHVHRKRTAGKRGSGVSPTEANNVTTEATSGNRLSANSVVLNMNSSLDSETNDLLHPATTLFATNPAEPTVSSTPIPAISLDQSALSLNTSGGDYKHQRRAHSKIPHDNSFDTNTQPIDELSPSMTRNHSGHRELNALHDDGSTSSHPRPLLVAPATAPDRQRRHRPHASKTYPAKQHQNEDRKSKISSEQQREAAGGIVGSTFSKLIDHEARMSSPSEDSESTVDDDHRSNASSEDNAHDSHLHAASLPVDSFSPERPNSLAFKSRGMAGTKHIIDNINNDTDENNNKHNMESKHLADLNILYNDTPKKAVNTPTSTLNKSWFLSSLATPFSSFSFRSSSPISPLTPSSSIVQFSPVSPLSSGTSTSMRGQVSAGSNPGIVSPQHKLAPHSPGGRLFQRKFSWKRGLSFNKNAASNSTATNNSKRRKSSKKSKVVVAQDDDSGIEGRQDAKSSVKRPLAITITDPTAYDSHSPTSRSRNYHDLPDDPTDITEFHTAALDVNSKPKFFTGDDSRTSEDKLALPGTAQALRDRYRARYQPSTSSRLPSPVLPTKPQHSYFIDETDLRVMEQGLLNLLEDFSAGKLRAFVGNQTLDKMKQVRDQQETLAKLHFELYTEQERISCRQGPGNVRQLADLNLKKLTDGLKELNGAIRELCVDEISR